MNYHINEVSRNGKQFVFVVRGRSKPFTDEEIEEFFKAQKGEEKRWAGIPEDRQRKIMFMKDIKMGLDYCVGKYGATKEEIMAEAQRIAPYYRMG